MNKIISYILSAMGLAIVAVSTKIFEIVSKLLPAVKLVYVLGFGVALILIGVFSLMSPSAPKTPKVAHAYEEVPIYEGEGKNRKIVGYRKN